MQRFAIRFAVISAIVLSAASASAKSYEFKECFEDARVVQCNFYNREGRLIRSEVTDKKTRKKTVFKKASVDGLTVATSVPRGDRPGRRTPVPGGELMAQGTAKPGDVVKDPRQCESGIAVLGDDGWICGGTQLVPTHAFTPAPGCRVIGRSPRGPIIGCGEFAQVPDPSVPVDEIFPGLPTPPPVPEMPQPSGDLIAMAAAEFKPVGTPKGGRGSGNQGSGASR